MYEEKEIKYKKRKITKKKNNKKEKTKNYIQKSKKNKKIPKFTNNINWKQLFFKLFILVLVMILIIFIISRINKNTKEKNIVLINNLNKIINATLKFYSEENLPQNINDSTSVLLDEMIEKEFLTTIKDKNNEECSNTNSYTILTKINENDYHLKIFLSCPNEEKTIKKELTCTNECYIKK